ncbi:MAG: hypothetical protein ACK5NB_03010 [Flavobacteriaceae bacterium]
MIIPITDFSTNFTDVLIYKDLFEYETYDYQEESLVFVAPGQILTVEKYLPDVKPKGKVLIFHLDFIRGTALGNILDDYSFFSYSSNEALHLSKKEREMVVNMYETIESELK